jgi:hypothetical protein
VLEVSNAGKLSIQQISDVKTGSSSDSSDSSSDSSKDTMAALGNNDRDNATESPTARWACLDLLQRFRLKK